MAAEVTKLGAARIAKDQTNRARLQVSDLGEDFYGLRAKLRELGVEYADE